jgi:hypothetical protein
MKLEISSCEMALWILETDRGTKRTYAVNKRAAKRKVEGKGLVVLRVRPATVNDLPENMLK